MVNFGILLPFGILYGRLVNFMAIWYSLWSFLIDFPFLVCLDQKKSGNPEPWASKLVFSKKERKKIFHSLCKTMERGQFAIRKTNLLRVPTKK
jgi:hypothetical protein